jgi:hypothetical protein
VILRRAALECIALVGALLVMIPAGAGVVDDEDGEDGEDARIRRGVAVGPGRIDVDDVLQPGLTYALPTITVRNPGTVASDYRMAIQAIETDAGIPDVDWIHFDPETFHLGPDERARVDVTITVPRGSRPGAYETLLTAQIASDVEGPSVGGAAAARLLFTVASTPSRPVIEPLVLAVLAVAAFIALILRFARRYRITIERRPDG